MWDRVLFVVEERMRYFWLLNQGTRVCWNRDERRVLRAAYFGGGGESMLVCLGVSVYSVLNFGGGGS